MPDQSSAERHSVRMARKKLAVDAAIAAAEREHGVFLVNTGNGKGKSSAAFGLVARAIGHGQRVAVVQLVKGRTDTGEEGFFRCFPDHVDWHVMGEGFTWETQDRELDAKAAQAAWKVARRYLAEFAGWISTRRCKRSLRVHHSSIWSSPVVQRPKR
ncbi:putative Corrinoid adenosyltransferase [Georgfuchsia toluolica]|uniref:corrinoid adenosyltransferase n=1 Tax=Georgfuchsia toluolica TaxID=424218 RepID=A0A916J3K3_9PROT|nr:putative Corrinoid adenosyltransferase [Georgfuchsia toluolica]